ncbi:MAG: hypothetical protein HY392_04120, partial [Candidatus Diapherotrites archaeon]|nr:hypothetical protein [Candidatus Diapherotrites archaeon]
FFKKIIFGSEETRPEHPRENQARDETIAVQKPVLGAKPSDSINRESGKPSPKQAAQEKPAKKTASREKVALAKPMQKTPAKKPVKPVPRKKIIPAKKAPKKTRAEKTLSGKNPAPKKTRAIGKPGKTTAKAKAKAPKTFVKQVWPKPRDSHIRHEKVKQLEQKISQLAKENAVSPDAMEQAAQMQAHEVIKQQSSLPNISETEEKIESAKKTGKGMEHHEILGLIGEIQKHRILTDFDRIYDEVTEKKRVSAASLSKDLEIPKGRVEECAKILEEDHLVEIEYPPVGDEFLQVAGYAEELKEEKEKQKNAKKLALKKINAKKGGALNG